jgi:hypothetical protein
MAGPTSARWGAAVVAFDFDLAAVVVLLISSLWFGGAAEGNKKPTAVASRGFVKFSGSTSTIGVASYYDDQSDNL